MADPNEIARYSFLPWMRTGVSAGVDAPDNMGAGARPRRAEIPVEVTVSSGIGQQTITKRVAMIGSGDVTGIDKRAIVRMEPPPNTMDFEPNYFPFIEWYEETLPWAYTPASANAADRLRPWCALLTLADGEYEEQSVPGAPLPAIAIADPSRVLPPPEELWGWAHVQADEDLAAEAAEAGVSVKERLDALLDRDPDRACSRILSPRRLRPNTGYFACLVPSFEIGRKTGLGQEVADDEDGLAAAWGSDPVVLPVYHRWRFRTGSRGDFEELVRRLEGRPVPPETGIRPLAVDAPGFGLPPVTPSTLGLEGALLAPGTTSTPWPDREPFESRLTELIDIGADLERPDHGNDATVSLPLYGRWHAKASHVGAADAPTWLKELNLDPRLRSIAGFGTLVVQRFQDRYLDAAWEQVGDVLAANRLIARARLAMLAARRIYRRIAAAPLDGLIRFTEPLHRKILGSSTTLYWQMRQSKSPRSLVDPAFRRALRPGGPIRRRAGRDSATGYDGLLTRVSSGDLEAVRPKRAGTKQQGFERDARQLLGEDRSRFSLRRWLAANRGLATILLLVIAAVAAVALMVAGLGALAVAAVAAGVAGSIAVATVSLPVAETALETLSNDELTAEALRDVPARPEFRLSDPGSEPPPPGRGGADSAEAARFRKALIDNQLMQASAPADVERSSLDVATMSTKLLAATDPAVTHELRLNARLRADLPAFGEPPPDPGRGTGLAPVMAAPVLEYPMYKELEKISTELLIPNLEKVPPNTLTLLEENRPFIEAYMVGLNHEILRELLYHEYPIWMQAMIFQQFWDPTDSASDEPGSSYDLTPIHTWAAGSMMGSHPIAAAASTERRLVLLVRGDLLRRYPNTLVTVAPAVWPEDATSTSDREPDFDNEIEPLFTANVGADITFFGFDLTADEARGSTDPADNDPGHFIVLRERPGDPRFGLDVAHEAATVVATKIEDLSWGHVGAPEDFDTLENVRLADGLHHVSIAAADNPQGVQWNTHAGELAHMLYQTPVVVAVHAHRMLAETPP